MVGGEVTGTVDETPEGVGALLVIEGGLVERLALPEGIGTEGVGRVRHDGEGEIVGPHGAGAEGQGVVDDGSGVVVGELKVHGEVSL